MLSVWIFTTPTSGAQWWDVSYSLEGLSISTHERGYLECVLTLNTDPAITRAMVSGGGTPFVQITDNAAPVWEGRIERVGRVDGNAVLYARGPYAATSDRTHTATYAMSNAGAFRPVEYNQFTAFFPSWWDLRADDSGLMITPRRGEAHGADTHAGGMYWVAPPNANNYIYSVTFDYEFNAPVGWNAFLRSLTYNANTAFSSDNIDWNLAGNGAYQSGTGVTQTVSANSDVVLFGMSSSNAAVALAVDTGTYYLRIHNIRVNGISSTPTTLNVVGGAIGQVAAQNPEQILATTVMVTASESVTDAVYSNADIQDVLADCAALGDGSNNPVEYGVWDDRALFFHTRGTGVRTWYTDETGFDVERGMEDVVNSIRVTYTDSFGNLAGSSVAEDLLSIAHWGIYRARRYESGVSKVNAADDIANTTLDRVSGVVPSIRGNLTAVIDGAGVVHPLHAVRANDLLVIRSLEYGDAAEGFNGFRISKTKYTAGVGRESLSIELESPNAAGSAFTSAAATKIPTVIRPPSPQPPGVGRPPIGQ